MRNSVKIAIARLLNRAGLLHSCYRLRATIRPRVRQIRQLRGVGRGRRCFIMGNGPSLLKISPGPLANEITFGTNAIYLVRDWLGFLPTYHVTEDVLVMQDRGHEIAALVGPVKFYAKKFRHWIPASGNVIHPHIEYDYSEYVGFPEFSRDASRCLWTGGTVSYLCLQLAYYFEFDPVILLGFDHNYVRPSHVTADGCKWTSHGDDPNHIHPSYFGAGKRWHDPRTDRMEIAYQRAKAEYELVDRTVLNATVGGKLEVFNRVDYASLFR